MLTRRSWLGSGLAAGLGLWVQPGAALAAGSQAPPGLSPSAHLWLTPQGQVLLRLWRGEMGQGVRTALPLLVAEELRLAPQRIQVLNARPGPEFDANSLQTGGSNSVAQSWLPLRQAGAAARELLLAAAARRWGVPVADCLAEDGWVRRRNGPGRWRYAELVSEAALLPVPADPPLTPAAQFRYIGRPQPLRDGAALAQGRQAFGIDLQLPGLQRALLLRPPRLGAQLQAWDEALVRAQPGLLGAQRVSAGLALRAQHSWPLLRARAAVAASLQWSGGEPGFDDAAQQALIDAAWAQPGVTVRQEGAPAGTAATLEAEYAFPFQVHAPMEPPNAIAWWRDGGLDVWIGSQAPNLVQRALMRAHGLSQEQVRVHPQRMGGGFGRRLKPDTALEAAELAKGLDAPLQLLWTREDDLAHGYYHPPSRHRLRAELDAQGRARHCRHAVAAPSIIFSEARRQVPPIPRTETLGAWDSPYAFDGLQALYHQAATPVPLGWWRAIQFVPSVLARECFIDELAEREGLDPLQWRLQRLPESTLELGEGARVERARLRQVLQRAAALADWGRQGPERRLGLACMAYHQSCVAQVAELQRAGAAWHLSRVFSVVDCGLLLDPRGAEVQVQGSVVWALSALRSAVHFEQGGVRERQLHALPLLRLHETPELPVEFMASEQAPSGLGEPAVPCVLPALLNALARATGRRVRRLPLGEQASELRLGLPPA